MGSILSILSRAINWIWRFLSRIVNWIRNFLGCGSEDENKNLVEILVANRIVTKIIIDDKLDINISGNISAREIVNVVLTNAGITIPGISEESEGRMFTLDRTIEQPSVDSFQTYCSKLEVVLGTPEPYQVSRRLERIDKYDLMDNMLNAILPDAIYLQPMIETAAENAVINSKKPTNSSSKKSLLSEMTVLIITTSGDNINFIVSQMSTFETMVIQNGLFWKNSEYEYVMDYKQKKFTLSKLKVQNIGQNIQKRIF